MDSLLISKARNGDMSAFEEIISLHEQSVYRIALRYTKNENDALDISQETFIKVYRALASFKGDSALSTWIYRIASNVCIDYIRKNSKSSEVPLYKTDDDGNTYDIGVESTIGNPAQAFETMETICEITNALEKLSDEHKEIIVLRDIEGFSYTEIADILELEEGTVKSRIARARKKIRTFLIETGNI